MQSHNRAPFIIVFIVLGAFFLLSINNPVVGNAGRVDTPTTVTLISPTNNSNVTNFVTFTWNAVKSSGYNIQISQDNVFSNIIVNNFTSSTKYTHNVVLDPKTYYWRVRYKNKNTYSAWSEVRSFNVAKVNTSSSSIKFQDDFSSYNTNLCLADGTVFGQWTLIFNGYGCVRVESDGTNKWLHQSPQASTSTAETHASLVTGPSFNQPFTIEMDVTTEQQLRTPTPNTWETAWILWDYTDNTHFYYFTLKTNGWEFGKADPAYPGAQRFLATGTDISVVIGQTYKVKIVQLSNTVSIYVNGNLVTTYTDTERPYTSGKIGLYNEDAHVRFDSVVVS